MRRRNQGRGKKNDVVQVALGFSDIYPGEPWTLSLLRSEIKKAGHFTTLNILARLNGAISGESEVPLMERQVAALHRLIPRKSPLAYRMVVQTLEHAEGRGPKIFTRSQLLELLRWTVLDVPANPEPYDRKFPISLERCESFLRASLMASELWKQHVFKTRFGEGLSLEEKRWKALREVRLGSEAGTMVGDWRIELGRGLYWFRDCLPEEDPEFLERFRSVTGLEILDYLAYVGALVTSSSGDVKFGLDPDHPWIREEERAGLRRFLDLEATSLGKLRKRLLKELGGSIPKETKDVPPLGLKPFREAPLLKLPSGATLVPDPVFLLDRASVGPFFLGLRGWKGRSDEAFGKFGTAVEKHVNRVLEVICSKDANTEGGVALDTSFDLVRSDGSSVEVDGMMVQRKTALIFEAKGSFGSEEALLSGVPKAYLENLDQKLVENSDRLVGIGQLARTVDLLARGALSSNDRHRLRKVRQVIPVLLVLDPGMAGILHRRYFGRRFIERLEGRTLKDDEAPGGPLKLGKLNVELPVILAVEDLETLEPLMDGGRLVAFFRAYVKECSDGVLPVRNYLAANGAGWGYRRRRYDGFREATTEVGDRFLEMLEEEALQRASAG